ncbi:MAG: hypothetical protein V4757_07145 [Pseudomonadota bacterium]
MATISYLAPSGQSIYGGRLAPVTPPPLPPGFSAVEQLRIDTVGPVSTLQQTVILSLHGSGSDPTSQGTLYEGTWDSSLLYETSDDMQWVLVKSNDGKGGAAFRVAPWDVDGEFTDTSARRESSWTGYTNGEVGSKVFRPITHERLDALLDWVDENVPQRSLTKRVGVGGSMGAQGILRYGLRRPARFAAIYPDRPIWRYRRMDNGGEIFVNDWDAGTLYYTSATAPAMAGGGTAFDYYDSIAYVADIGNAVPWVGWCVGRNDGGMPFADHIAAVAALRAAGRGFCFAWNDGNHSTGSIMTQITASYPYALFELGKGYPIFSDHSLDKDPAVDLTGGINLGLSFRNVVESVGAWSCEVSHTSAACTVKVKPRSQIFLGSPAATTVTLPAANTWVAVSFTA